MSIPPPLPSGPSPLPYASVSQRRPLAWGWHIALMVVIGGCWLAFVGITLFAVPRFERIFSEFKTGLPGLTALVLWFSRWGGDWFGLAVTLLIACGLIAGGILLDSAARDSGPIRRYGKIVLLLVVGLFAVYLLLTMIGLFAPLVSVTNAVSSTR